MNRSRASLEAEIERRERAERARQAAETQFEQLIAGVRDYAIFLLDTAGHVISWNAGAERIKGYRADEIIGQHFSRFYTPPDQQADRPGRALQTAAAEGRFEGEGWRVRRDGSWFWANVVITALRDAHGNLQGFLKITRDLTERRQAEERLRQANTELERKVQERSAQLIEANRNLREEIARRRQNEATLRRQADLLEQAYDALFMWEFPGPIFYWNPAAEALYGYGPDEALGRVSHDLLHTVFPHGRAAFEASIEQAGRWAGELTHTKKNGERITVDSRLRLITERDGRRVVLETTRDVTERKRVAEALRESEERYRGVFELAAVGIARVALDGTWLDVNRRLCQIAGYECSEMRSLTFQQITYPPDLDRDLALLRQLLAGEIPSYSMEKRYVRKDGALVWVRLTVAVVREADGAAKYFVAVIEDISEQKQAEEEVRRLTESLERLVGERTAELEEVVQSLKAFSYSVSHDLRAPLRNVQALAQALLEDYADRLDATGREYTDRLVATARRMDGLIQDLLNYSRLTRAALQPGPVHLGRVVAEAVANLEPDIRERRAVVTQDPDMPMVLAHRPTLVLVVENMLANALKFVEPGVAPRVRLRAEERGEWVRLWVEDNGIGIAPEHRERIFGVFERLHGEESYPGTGIGLAIVQKGAERMGGRSGVESELGKGSRFWIELPGGREPR